MSLRIETNNKQIKNIVLIINYMINKLLGVIKDMDRFGAVFRP